MRLVLVALLLLVTPVTGTRAAAVTGPRAAAEVINEVVNCELAEQVYGINLVGDLIVQPFCVIPERVFLPPRTLAAFGPDVPRLFYGGQLSDATVVIYGVGADGALRWYRENRLTGQLDPGVVVGARFGDWRGFEDLQVLAGGDLSGVDSQGRVWRWVHTGWEDGADIWAADEPEYLGTSCPGVRPVFVGRGAEDFYVGVSGRTHGFVYCGHTGKAREASLLPAEADAVTMAASPGVTYAVRGSDHRLMRLILDTPYWRVDAVGRVPLWGIFTGRAIAGGLPPIFKYEWQWTWYGEYS
jgi:hypothetical protein